MYIGPDFKSSDPISASGFRFTGLRFSDPPIHRIPSRGGIFLKTLDEEHITAKERVILRSHDSTTDR